MTGVFGGLLGIVNLIGALVLFVIIGTKAFTENKTARNFRLAFGSLVIGEIIGLIWYWRLPPPTSGVDSSFEMCFVAIPALVGILVFLLDTIRKSIDD